MASGETLLPLAIVKDETSKNCDNSVTPMMSAAAVETLSPSRNCGARRSNGSWPDFTCSVMLLRAMCHRSAARSPLSAPVIGPECCRLVEGSSRWMVVPRPRVLDADTRPPWRVAIAFTIARPSPLPWPRDERALKNLSKIRGRCSGAIPSPESVTLKRTVPSERSAAR